MLNASVEGVSFMSDKNRDDLNKAKKLARATNNCVKLMEAAESLNQSCYKNVIFDYVDWLIKLVVNGDDPDIVVDQFDRVAPTIIKFLNETEALNKALIEEMEGNRSDIFDFDDSFFNIDDSADK